MFYRQIFRHILIQTFKSKNFSQKHGEKEVSKLFVPGRHGNIYRIVKPYIDANEIITNLDKIKLNSDKRGLDFCTEGLIPKIKKWHVLKQTVSELTKQLEENQEELKTSESKKVNQPILKDLHSQKRALYDLEDELMDVFRLIPNILHSKTPNTDTPIVYIEPKEFNFNVKSHTEIGGKMGCLTFSPLGHTSYYLSGILSVMELAIQNYVCDHLHHNGFVPISSVDFSKSFVLEGCGKSPQSASQYLPLQGKEFGQRIHLVGSSSLESLCSHFINMNLSKSSLPMQYFTVGRQFNSEHCNNKSQSLFTVVQSTCIHSAIVSDMSIANDCFEKLFNTFIFIFNQLQIPFRTLNVSIKNLDPVESRKIRIEVWSPHKKCYVTCGEVVQCDNFVSKRLHMMFGENHVREGYLNLVHGPCVNVAVLIACIIENLQNADFSFSLPNELKKFMVL